MEYGVDELAFACSRVFSAELSVVVQVAGPVVRIDAAVYQPRSINK